MSVRLAALADQDLRAITVHSASENADSVLDLLARFQKRFFQLSEFPRLGRPRPDIAKGIRGLLVSPYVALYRIETSGVVILRVLYTSRDLRGSVLQ